MQLSAFRVWHPLRTTLKSLRPVADLVTIHNLFERRREREEREERQQKCTWVHAEGNAYDHPPHVTTEAIGKQWNFPKSVAGGPRLEIFKEARMGSEADFLKTSYGQTTSQRWGERPQGLKRPRERSKYH